VRSAPHTLWQSGSTGQARWGGGTIQAVPGTATVPSAPCASATPSDNLHFWPLRRGVWPRGTNDGNLLGRPNSPEPAGAGSYGKARDMRHRPHRPRRDG